MIQYEMSLGEKDIYDVVVAGGGTAGWVAALAAARQGKKTILIEKKGYLGGCLSSGLPILGFFDIEHRQTVKGYANEFVETAMENGGSDGFIFTDQWIISSVPLNSAIVKPTIINMLVEAGVEILMFTQVVDVVMEGNRIIGVQVQGKSDMEIIMGKIFIDTTGDAFVSYLAEVPMQISRDFQPPTLLFRLENVDLGELNHHLVTHPEEFYSNRLLPGKMISQTFFDNIPVYLVFQELIEKVNHVGGYKPFVDRFMFMPVPGTGGRAVVVNTLRALNVDGQSSKSLSEATLQLYGNLLLLVDFFKENIPGFKNCYLSDSEPEIQLRETRRIIGDYLLTAQDIIDGRMFEDNIALGCYYIDVHSSKDSGNSNIFTEKPYGIPYRTLIPKKIEGLIVAGRCISGTKEAAGSYRVMSQCMATGQAAGTAAAISVKEGMLPRVINVQALKEILLKEGAVLSL